MNFIETLQWRGMLADHTPDLPQALMKGMVTGYIGFDPTAPSLTIGNYVQIMLLKHFQLFGHKPIVLMGGATGRIGDPSGKDKERELKSEEELDRNLQFQQQQFTKFLDFDQGKNQALFENNFNFYKDFNVLDFLRQVGKHLTVNYMLSKESVQKRLETGISFTEFSYQLLQAYDYFCLYNKYGCTLQMGGSDQWGNITAGTEYIRRNTTGAEVHALTSPLLTKSDGKKFGKSEEGNIWLDPQLTSPYKFYQFWINSDDQDLSKFLRIFSLKDKTEIEQLESESMSNPQTIKRVLAEELTRRIHSDEAYNSAMQVSELLFNPKVTTEFLFLLTNQQYEDIAGELPTFKINRDQFQNITVTDLLTALAPICSSRSEARKAIQNQAISINKFKITEHEFPITSNQFIRDQWMVVENGKKNKYLLIAV
ncbi:MAG: tyrosine--tRNA ligase [Saprospiraceae bacterium]|nr:tyrosine--tRNA ligase [Saprospiraceae bacterium]